MHKREVQNHNDKYVVFFDFDDEQDELDTIEEPLPESKVISPDS
jgi:hypothetical protein